jgi:hypothetical protein
VASPGWCCCTCCALASIAAAQSTCSGKPMPGQLPR